MMTDTQKPGDSDTPSADAPTKPDINDLNSVLASWDSDEASKPNDDTPAPAPAPVSEGFGSMEYAIDKTVATIKGDLDLPDKFVRQYLKGLADENEGFDLAFRERGINPEKWDQVLSSVADEFQSTMTPKTDTNNTDVAETIDDKGLAAAVHTARTTDAVKGGLDDLDYGSMSDSEFEMKKGEIFRLAEAGKLK